MRLPEGDSSSGQCDGEARGEESPLLRTFWEGGDKIFSGCVVGGKMGRPAE